jgi:molybdopterin-guanine dinucleotide biosynthesis protein A
VVRLVREAVETVVVVAASGQPLPPLPQEIQVVRDRQPDRGPLEGLATGLRALDGQVTAAYATGCDVPLLVPGFVQLLFELLADHDIAVPRDQKYHHPLAAVYRVPVYQHAQRLLQAKRVRPFYLFEEVNTLEISVDLLRQRDPELTTLENLNRPQDYFTALERAGFERPSSMPE